MYGWGTEEEEDIWELELDFGGGVERAGAGEAEMTVGELTEWRYIKAEREKELVNICPPLCSVSSILKAGSDPRSYRATRRSRKGTTSPPYSTTPRPTRSSQRCRITSSTSPQLISNSTGMRVPPLLLLAYAPLIDNVASIFSLFARTFFFAVLPFASSHVDGWKPKLRATRP